MPNPSSQEKTEQATPRRLREARKKGQVPKSRDLAQVFVLIVVFVTLAFTFGSLGGEFKKLFLLCFDSLAQPEITGGVIWALGKASLFTMAKALLPIMGAALAIAILTNMIQVGAIFSGDPLTPKPERLNPIEGLKNMFKIVTLIELVKNMAKIAIVFYIAYSTLKKYIDGVLLSSRIDMLSSAKITGEIVFEFMIKVSICFIILSIIDYAVQRWNFMKNMRMSKDEVKREYKQDEGDPAIKGERRRLHREMAFGNAKKAVKQSDVVVTNPTHVAVALEYKKEGMAAPKITTKGQEIAAEMIVEIAREEGIPIIRNVPLAWSLLQLEIGDEIPENLYEAVAEVLTLVYEMKQKQEGNEAPSQKNVPIIYA